MMKTIFILSFLLLFGSAGVMAQTTKAKSVTAKQQEYTCPMHSDVVSNKPGKCPKCGMTLVEKKNTKLMDSSSRKTKK